MQPPPIHNHTFTEMADPQAFHALFEHLPDVFFFAKDLQSRLITASQTMCERLGLKSPADLVNGRDDEEFFPPHVAKMFRDDDRIVFRTGKPVIERLEVFYDEHRKLNWFITTKVAARDRTGAIIGLMGITRRDARRDLYELDDEVKRVMKHIEQNTHRLLSTGVLARECGMSERTLFRKIKEAAGVTPYELTLRIRVQKAAEALIETDDKVASIARAHGFCNQSTFTQHFRRRTGMTPKQFRVRHLGPAVSSDPQK